jgi:hypothetical protein
MERMKLRKLASTPRTAFSAMPMKLVGSTNSKDHQSRGTSPTMSPARTKPLMTVL